jgi:hypothetical protein
MFCPKDILAKKSKRRRSGIIMARNSSFAREEKAKVFTMTKRNDNDMVPRLALGLAIFVAMKCAPRLIEWWNKRKEKAG